MQITYDDHNLQALFEELDPRARARSLKGAMRTAAKKMRRRAVENLRASGLASSRDMERGVRALVFKRVAGFRVTIGTERASKRNKGHEKGFHINRRGLHKPVLIWAEAGTQDRATATGHRTGRMPAYGFMQKTLEQNAAATGQELQDALAQNITRIAAKYGARV